ncbi:Carbonic anhydrase 2 [BD1-7 clade bacterium]|uniref:carbonic anhydrase n=1 Tax=BD1-7 clade bacterium TaxID=2029982 RepID=A0A5S9P760_9GAMM|nr:Carbonic anhydrase 2 [BD1-7 clade bacterium]CAA0099458.1 Carbonic anhydrase 2 [BD1-7 clade bacterium]
MCNSSTPCTDTDRRSFLKTAGLTMLGTTALAHTSTAAALPKPENNISAKEAMKRLNAGNTRYVEGKSTLHDFKSEREVLSGGQNPYAAILSCADSRIVPEYTFDSARGDLFVVRIAGNFASVDAIASLEYTVGVLGTPLIMVLGHEKCGAVAGAISSIREGAELPANIPKLVNAISPAVGLALKHPHEDQLLKHAIRENVRLNVATLKAASPMLSKLYALGDIDIVGGVYNLNTGRVDRVS